MQRTPLAASHVQALRNDGKPVTHPGGAILARSGEPTTRFVYVEEGEVEVVNPYTNEGHTPFTLGPTQFMGEISLLNGGAGSLTMRAVRETRVIEVQRGPMLTLMSRIPEMSDIIITVFSARRRGALDERDGSLQLIGEDEDRNVLRIAEFASRNRIPYSSWPVRTQSIRNEPKWIKDCTKIRARALDFLEGRMNLIEAAVALQTLASALMLNPTRT